MGHGDSPEGSRPGRILVQPQVSAYLYPWDWLGDPLVVSRLGLRRTPERERRRRLPQRAGSDAAASRAPFRRRRDRRALPSGPKCRVGGTPALPVRRAVDGLAKTPFNGRSKFSVPAGCGSARGSCSPTTAPWAVGTGTWSLATASVTATSGRSALPTVRYASTLPCSRPRRCLAFRWRGSRSRPAANSGAEHGGHHEKTVGAYTPLAELILSICCCGACRRVWKAEGLDACATVQALREAFEAAQRQAVGVDATPEDVLGTPLAGLLLSCRQLHTDALLEGVLAAFRVSSLACGSHCTPSQTRGPPELHPGSRRNRPGGQRGAGSCPGGVPAGRGRSCGSPVLGAGRRRRGGLRQSPGAHRARRSRWASTLLLQAGADELHLYHFGLANEQQLPLFSRLASLSA